MRFRSAVVLAISSAPLACGPLPDQLTGPCRNMSLSVVDQAVAKPANVGLRLHVSCDGSGLEPVSGAIGSEISRSSRSTSRQRATICVSSARCNGTSSSYPARTRLNVEQSDGTVWFGYALAPGGKLTIGHCKKIGRPCIVNPSPEQLAAWVEANGIKTLNVAGNRESAFNPDISLRVFQTLVKAFGSAEQIAALV